MTDDLIVVSSRIRLARNLRGYAFPCMIAGTPASERLTDALSGIFLKTGEFSVRKMSDLPPLEARSLVERYLISPKLAEGGQGAVAISDDGLISVMINEEDHLREQIIYRGLDLERAYQRISNLDGILRANVDFAVSGNTYYTACPSNLGTGMRASVMLFLPATVACGELEALRFEAERKGLIVRGAFGEGSGGEGYLYQVSNEVTYNITEQEILSIVKRFTSAVVRRERALRERLYNADRLRFADDCLRALGVAENAMLLSYEEFCRLTASVKLGIAAGLIACEDPYRLDDLIVAARSATLKLSSGTDVSEDALRASFVKDNLKKLGLRPVATRLDALRTAFDTVDEG